MRTLSFLLALLLPASAAAQPAPSTLTAEQYARDADEVRRIILDNYAFLDRFTGEPASSNPVLQAEAVAVKDRRSLVRYAERALMALADHHAHTGSSLTDSWALVPSFADLWIEERDGRYFVDAVREQSPAAGAGIARGDELMAVGDQPTDVAVSAFWQDLGVTRHDSEARAFAARILAAGRRDRARHLTLRTRSGERTPSLRSLYDMPRRDRPPVSVTQTGRCLAIRFNDSLGDDQTILAFDAAMQIAEPRQPICLELTDTPSGGNTVVARAIMGWFVTEATAYQIHHIPSERGSGIERRWIEQVLPRLDKHHAGRVDVRVGRWTGSMGEGLAIGFQALGGSLSGGNMAGLRGAIYNFPLSASGLLVNLPAERLYAVDGTPREDVTVLPRP